MQNHIVLRPVSDSLGNLEGVSLFGLACFFNAEHASVMAFVSGLREEKIFFTLSLDR